MNKLSKTLIAAAITGVIAIPAANAEVDQAVYSKNATGKITFSGSKCRTLKYKDLNATMFVEGGFEGGIEGGLEGGANTSIYFLDMSTFGGAVDGSGPLVASNKGRTYNMDTTFEGYNDIQSQFQQYIFAGLQGQDIDDGCKDPQGFNFGSLMLNRYEFKLSNNGNKGKLKFEAEATYDDNNAKERKLKLKADAKMDLQNVQ